MSDVTIARYRRLVQMRALQQRMAEAALARAEAELTAAADAARDARDQAEAAAMDAMLEGDISMDELLDSRAAADFFAAGAQRAAHTVHVSHIERARKQEQLRRAALATRQMEAVVESAADLARMDEGRRERVLVDEVAARTRIKGRQK